MCAASLLPRQHELQQTTSNAAQPAACERDGVERYLNMPIQFNLADEIKKATNTLINFTDDNAIEGSDSVPSELIAGAHGLAFITTMQAGFFFSARAGSGLVEVERSRGARLVKCTACGGFLPWQSWERVLSSEAGNGGVVRAPKGRTSAFYSVEKATAASREMAARRARDGEASSDRDGDDDAGLG